MDRRDRQPMGLQDDALELHRPLGGMDHVADGIPPTGCTPAAGRSRCGGRSGGRLCPRYVSALVVGHGLFWQLAGQPLVPSHDHNWIVVSRNLARHASQSGANSRTCRGHGADCTSASRTRDAADYPGDRSHRCRTLGARLFSPISYTDPRIEFFASNDPSPDPYGTHNLLTASFPGNGLAKPYVHARITLSHAPGQRLRTIPTMCRLVDSTGDLLIEPKKLLVRVPDAVSGPRSYPKTSWIALSAAGPWKPGS